ncbi:hypothetical protein PEBR_17202 [Penicillium brasilianum]|uniref:Uncharacterized protein n=1 Tax=Penicillium brasilianum TaxID=104259 RepID=A0A1S9RQU9_PENBI|nr:hypothetical protein PEBR_17202 [Penicillium brasilianum]
MCYKVVERYSVCKCVYFQHSIDPCSAYGQRGHSVQEKTVLVGYACSRHSARGASSSPNAGRGPDSGNEKTNRDEEERSIVVYFGRRGHARKRYTRRERRMKSQAPQRTMKQHSDSLRESAMFNSTYDQDDSGLCLANPYASPPVPAIGGLR